MTQRVLAELTRAIGEAVSTEPNRLDAMRSDKSGYISDSPPLVVGTARSIDDVRTTLRIANEPRTPVVIRGAGSAS